MADGGAPPRENGVSKNAAGKSGNKRTTFSLANTYTSVYVRGQRAFDIHKTYAVRGRIQRDHLSPVQHFDTIRFSPFFFFRPRLFPAITDKRHEYLRCVQYSTHLVCLLRSIIFAFSVLAQYPLGFCSPSANLQRPVDKLKTRSFSNDPHFRSVSVAPTFCFNARAQDSGSD